MLFKLIFAFVSNLLCLSDSLLAFEQNIFYDSISKSFKLTAANRTVVSGSLANTLSARGGIDFEIDNNNIGQSLFFSNEKIRLKVDTYLKEDEKITCQTFTWKFLDKTLTATSGIDELIDCFDLKGSFWYGGSEMSDQQFWPINNQVMKWLFLK